MTFLQISLQFLTKIPNEKFQILFLGPLMNEKSGRWYLIGIVSAGYSCASRGQPGIYHRVAHTVDWISHIVNNAAA